MLDLESRLTGVEALASVCSVLVTELALDLVAKGVSVLLLGGEPRRLGECELLF